MHFHGKEHTKHRDLELANYGEGNVNMGAGFSVFRRGDGHNLQLEPGSWKEIKERRRKM